MDIHKPKHPIDSLRAFGLEIFTVTCGILIALGLEALIVAHHEGELRRQAAESFLAELDANRHMLEQQHTEIPGQTASLTALIEYDEARLAHRPAKLPAARLVRRFSTLQDTAWQTALATGAIARFALPDVQRLSAVHDAFESFNVFQQRARDQWVGIAAFGNPDQLDDAGLRAALGALQVAYAYAISLDTIGQALLPKIAAAGGALRAP